MFCRNCGTEIPDNIMYCPKCGQSQQTSPMPGPMQNPYANQYDIYEQAPKEKQGMAITSLVLGLVGLIGWLFPCCGYPITILGLIFGIIGIKKGGKTMATVGIVLSSITLVLTIINFIVAFYLNVQDQMFWQEKIEDTREIQEKIEDIREIQEEIEEEEESDNTSRNNEYKEYVMYSEYGVDDEAKKDIIYVLESRAKEYTSRADIEMKKSNSEWNVEISMPEVDDSSYEEVTKPVDVSFVGGYGTDKEEVIVSGMNINFVSIMNNDPGEDAYYICIYFDEEGSEKIAAGTEKFLNDTITIFVNDENFYSAAVCNVITDGEVALSADSYQGAELLKAILNAGSLGIEFVEVE